MAQRAAAPEKARPTRPSMKPRGVFGSGGGGTRGAPGLAGARRPATAPPRTRWPVPVPVPVGRRDAARSPPIAATAVGPATVGPLPPSPPVRLLPAAPLLPALPLLPACLIWVVPPPASAPPMPPKLGISRPRPPKLGISREATRARPPVMAACAAIWSATDSRRSAVAEAAAAAAAGVGPRAMPPEPPRARMGGGCVVSGSRARDGREPK